MSARLPHAKTHGVAADWTSAYNRILGFSAVQQPEAPTDLLSHPPAEPYTAPGDATTANALGYLHANCGHCHNPDGTADAFVDMNLRLDVSHASPASTNAYATAVGADLQYFEAGDLSQRITPGDAAQSAVHWRMSQRAAVGTGLSAGDDRLQMPPIASERIDTAGAAVIEAWIDAL